MNIQRSIVLHRKPWKEEDKPNPIMIDVDAIIGFEEGHVFTKNIDFAVEESYDCIVDKINEVGENKRSLNHFEEVHTEAMAFLAGKIFRGTRKE